MKLSTLILKTTLALCVALLCAGTASAQIGIVSKGKPTARIVADTANRHDMQAAELLRRFIGEMSGAQIPVLAYDAAATPRRGDIVIRTDGQGAIGEDGFEISTRGGILRITGGGGQGSAYGAVTLLERYLGMNYWSLGEYDLPHSRDIALPLIETVERPAFRYRQSQNYALEADSVYRVWNRLEMPREVFAANHWVHTFDRLIPSDVYGETHPEYYSYFKGRRQPGKGSQLCLSNPEVFELISQKVDSLFRISPGMNLISVSQNDSNNTQCTCEECSRVDEYEGAPSGSLIHFMNKLAQRFPDKEFSTLAYLYSMKPPRHVKPLPNVNIMLCSINCTREVSLTENASGREFVEAMEGWSAISDNIFVWDYGINFDNYIAPFPNFHVMADNIRLFRRHNANMLFSQISATLGCDFAEMRTWLASKLMWNPDQDTDSLMRTFMDGYYGDAGDYLYRYAKLMEGALLGSGVRLWIYDSPTSHSDGMLKPELIRRYKQLFDRAEAAVADDSVRLARVRRSRLSLQYAELETARKLPAKDTAEVAKSLDLFQESIGLFGITLLNEKKNSPAYYCETYRSRYLKPADKSLAHGTQVNYLVAPSRPYDQHGPGVLTDGVLGGSTFGDGWVGWVGKDASMVLDLGEQMEVSAIEADFLHALGSWILLPEQVSYSISGDGENFTLAGSYDIEEDQSPQIRFVGIRHDFDRPVAARYIKVDAVGTKVCPSWHYGVGHASWLFIDEISVY